MPTYQEYIDQEYKKAQQEMDEYTAQQKSALDLYLKALQNTKDRDVENENAATAQKMQAAKETRQETLNKAEVTRRIAERNIRERLSNLGLADSGREHAERAAAGSRSRTAAAAAEQKYRDLAAQLSEKLRTYTAAREERYDDAVAQKTDAFNTKIANKAAALDKHALNSATSLYKNFQNEQERAERKATAAAKAAAKEAEDKAKAEEKALRAAARITPLGVTSKNTLTADQMNSPAFKRHVMAVIAADHSLDPLITAIRNTISFTHYSFRRICVFLNSLDLSAEDKKYVADNVTITFRDYYKRYMQDLEKEQKKGKKG